MNDEIRNIPLRVEKDVNDNVVVVNKEYFGPIISRLEEENRELKSRVDAIKGKIEEMPLNIAV